MQAARYVAIIIFLMWCMPLYAQKWISDKKQAGAFAIVEQQQSALIYVDANEPVLVKKAAAFLQQDIKAVTSVQPVITNKIPRTAKYIIVIGTLEGSSLIKELVKKRKIDPASINKKWEAYSVQLVQKPFTGIEQALVIAGSDRRGTAYGVFELSKQMGVSPWYWWADVPVPKKPALYARKDLLTSDAPAVKYRGIFINDEAPALSGWTKEKFGGFNHQLYEKVFELMLRLKSNYLWPAMWGNAFYDDDPLNIKAADDFGIVIGTSHHEPLMRAHDEWRRYGRGKWNYDSNETKLKEFWRGGLTRAAKTEKIVSVGMRGDGDEPMTRETATALLERIVKDQRNIIEEVSGKAASETPQLWALYKEVQDYYDKGMRVPDDVTLLLCDDNWGNIRRLPKLNEPKRKGGYGIYYHFDYVGGPRNYKWINTNNISRVWEQMHLAWEYGAREIWIVNVGDIKPMELPISFFLDYAWNPEKIKVEDIPAYHRQWAAQQFDEKYTGEIGYILQKYTQYNSRRKPELLSPSTYALTDDYRKFYREWDWVVDGEFRLLASVTDAVKSRLPKEYHNAFYQLVEFPVKASHNLNDLYRWVAHNHNHAKLQDAAANGDAYTVKRLYNLDSAMTADYHKINGGKWNHMMDQTHIGYTNWQQPLVNAMPELRYVQKDSATSVKGEIYPDSDVTALSLIPRIGDGNLFYEKNGYVSIDAEHYTQAFAANTLEWKIIPEIGRNSSGVTIFPVTSATHTPPIGPRLEYEVYVYDTGKVQVLAYFSPTLNLFNNDGLKYAVSIDDEQPQIISINKEDNNVRTWEQWVANNIIIKTSSHSITTQGRHLLKFWAVDPCVVLQKLVMNFGGLKPSYLGPPETKIER
ncbi:MAG: glycosyl hydrolase 115 family protein [Chitinophagaceae bacterium]